MEEKRQSSWYSISCYAGAFCVMWTCWEIVPIFLCQAHEWWPSWTILQRSNDEGRKVLCHSLSEESWQYVGLRCWAQMNGETCKHLAAPNPVLAGPDVFSAPTLSVTLLPLYDMNSITRIMVCLIIQGTFQRSHVTPVRALHLWLQEKEAMLHWSRQGVFEELQSPGQSGHFRPSAFF